LVLAKPEDDDSAVKDLGHTATASAVPSSASVKADPTTLGGVATAEYVIEHEQGRGGIGIV
jgi:hypothetical protein